MKKILTVVLAALVAAQTAVLVFAQAPSAAELLKKVDDNEIYDSIEYEARMIVDYNKLHFEKEFTAYARGNAYSYMEFTNHEDAGTKYLKRENRLYVYSPDSEQVQQITGHMLQRSMMNSDISYEDSIENETLSARYTPRVAGSVAYNGRECWLLELTAKKKTESYPTRKLWIDKETLDLLHYELFPPSGKEPLKEYNLLRYEVINGMRFPVEFELRDLRRKGSKTTLIMTKVSINKPIDDSRFSERTLDRN